MADSDGALSKRGAACCHRGLTYLGAVMKLLERTWSPEDQDGNLVMSIAENRLTVDLMMKKLEACLPRLPETIFYYDNMAGTLRFRKALAAMMQHTFMKGVEVDPNNLMLASGCSAIVNNAIFGLTEEGEGIMLPAPAYPAFDWDIEARNGAVPIYVHLSAHQEPYDTQLDRAAAAFHSKTGKQVRALLLANPDNPTGTLYSRECLSQMMSWCVDNKVHYISDEIYANAVFGKGSFIAAEQLAAEEVEAGNMERQDTDLFVHTIYGLSKDWCASGLRVGCLYTRNKLLLKQMASINYFCSISNLAQEACARMLEDKSWVDSYMTENTQRLGASYRALTDALDKAHIPYTPAAASVFCVVDLRAALPAPTWEAERELWEQGFVLRCGLIITPGNDCHCSEPGFFRICFAQYPPAAVQQLVDRISAFVAKSPEERRRCPVKPWLQDYAAAQGVAAKKASQHAGSAAAAASS